MFTRVVYTAVAASFTVGEGEGRDEDPENTSLTNREERTQMRARFTRTTAIKITITNLVRLEAKEFTRGVKEASHLHLHLRFQVLATMATMGGSHVARSWNGRKGTIGSASGTQQPNQTTLQSIDCIRAWESAST